MSGQAVGSLLAPLAIVVLGPSRAFIPIGLIVILTAAVTHATVRAQAPDWPIRTATIRALTDSELARGSARRSSSPP